MFTPTRFFYVLLLLSFLATPVVAQTLIAGWDFQTATTGGTVIAAAPNTPNLLLSNFGNGQIHLDGTLGSSTWVTSTTGNQVSAFGGTAINAGTGFQTTTNGASALATLNTSANGKSLVFAFSMTGYKDLAISYATQRSATGFTTQQWEFSTDAQNWTQWQNVSPGTSFSLQNLNPITGLNFSANAYLRLTFSGASGSSGNNRIDNIQFNATPSLPPPVINVVNANATVGQSFSYQISASNSPVQFLASPLPDGLTLNSNTGFITGIPLHASNAFSITLSASNSGGVGNTTIVIQIAKGAQSINMNAIPVQTYGNAPFPLQASGGASQNPVIFQSSDTNIVKPIGNQLNIMGGGTIVLSATQAGNADYDAAPAVSQTVVVNQASQSITFLSPGNKLITDTPFLLSAIGGASGNAIVFASTDTSILQIAGNTGIIVGAGNVGIIATQAGNDNYAAATPVTQNIQINKLSQTINFPPISAKQLSNISFTLNASGGASGMPLQFTSSNPQVATVNGNIVTLLTSGICLITASQTGNYYYDAAPDVSRILVVNQSSQTLTYTFGTASAATALPTNGLPITNLTASSITQGNNANITQTSLVMSTTSASTNSGSSGEMNAGITARNRSFQADSSAYFEFALTPSGSTVLTVNSISLNTRSTSTGPTNIELRSSIDNYASPLSVLNVTANSAWTNQVFNITPYGYNQAQTFRIYGYVTGGSGSVNTGSSANNWRVDDIKPNLSLTAGVACSLSLTASASPIICNGGTSNIHLVVSGTTASLLYQINGGQTQGSADFLNMPAASYTVTATDALGCSASTQIIISEPTAPAVSASSVNTCVGDSVALFGFPSGGLFSVANPYLGPSTTYTYTYTESNGCTYTSLPANIQVTPCATLQVKLFFEGYYLGAQTMNSVLMNQGIGNDGNIVDDITVELHDPTTFSLVASASALLHTNGIATFSFPNRSGYCYLVVRYRNGVATWSALPVLLGNGLTIYDFSNNQNKSYGNNLQSIAPGVWGIYSGDVNQDENIDLLDLAEAEFDVAQFNAGYLHTDINGDGNVDLLDVPLIENNSNQFIYAAHPAYIPFPETMEGAVKTSYTAADITLQTGVWNANDALLGNSSSDRKNGSQSARIQNTGKLSMKFDVYIDTSVVTVFHGRYGSDANSTWALFSSIDAGVSWVQQGAIITCSSTTLQQVSIPINITGNVRFEIRKLSGGKLNIDDFSIVENSSNTSIDNDPLSLGNPSNATTDITQPNNYLLVKPQYVLAYNNSKGEADWVAWHLDQNDLGTTPRCDCFTADNQLPSSFYKAGASSYSGSGFDRGHQLPSSQRNNSITNNAATFLMSNMLPQSPNLNQITWNNAEAYCTSLANAGYELYTYSGGYGMGGSGSNGGLTNTIANGNIQVPAHCWKIILILPQGTNDISRITNSTRVIALDMPNTQTVNTATWGMYRTSVDAIESNTGFDFFSNLPTSLQSTLEAQIDNGPVN
jgi:endonuclease G